MPFSVSNLLLNTPLTEIASSTSPWPLVVLVSIFTNSILWISIVLVVMLWSLFQTFNHNPPSHFIRTWVQLFVFYLGFTMPWWIAVILLYWLTSVLPVATAIILLLITGLYFYTVYIAPRMLKVHHINSTALWRTDSASSLQTTKVAIVSDLRLGLFSHPKQLTNLVHAINQLEVDAVIILGEWLYNPRADLVGQLMMLKGINKPLYVNQSPHDQRYYPKNADLFLHEDDLTHTFASLGVMEVTAPTITDLGLTLIPTTVPDAIQIVATPMLTATSAGTILPLDSDKAKRLETRQLLSDESPVLTLLPASSQSDLAALPAPSVQVIPSFGQRGLPLRLSHPSITVLHLKAQ